MREHRGPRLWYPGADFQHPVPVVNVEVFSIRTIKSGLVLEDTARPPVVDLGSGQHRSFLLVVSIWQCLTIVGGFRSWTTVPILADGRAR
jgi:hypothetical protein